MKARHCKRWMYGLLLVITKGYRVRATTIEDQNAFASCASSKFHVTDSQNTRDQITSDRRSKRT